jgi:hypothetical protein
MRGRGDVSLTRALAQLYLDYKPADYDLAFTLSGAVDPAGIEAKVRSGVLYLRLPKSGPLSASASRQRQIEDLNAQRWGAGLSPPIGLAARQQLVETRQLDFA